jgi:hypothetical protein
MSVKFIQSLILLAFSAALMVLSGMGFSSLYEREPVFTGPGVTQVRKLSDYFSGLKGTVGDTTVYILEGDRRGGTVFVMGGVHANESAGMLSAVVLVENAVVKTGRVIIVPHANESGFTHNAPSEGVPARFRIKTEWGARWFRFGDRLTNPVHQWPDPEVYVHYPSGQLLSDFDVRNLDRAFPGRPNGIFTEVIGYALTELVRKEKADLTLDLHEARPMNPIVNCIIAHERAREIASIAAIDLEVKGIKMRLEPSPKKLRGISHRELGDHSDTVAMLMETASPILDRLHGRTDEELILTGKDDFFLKAASKELLYVPYNEKGLPMEERVGRHLSSVQELINIFSELHPEKAVEIEQVPDYKTVKEKGVGHFLLKP